ncbi:MAG: DNA alkylation repair protein [Acidobacteria bacterium]|nr:DNA alkylation repair protein [Acidobacteriota bacterium]
MSARGRAGGAGLTVEGIILELERRKHPEALEGMARYGIDVTRAYGIAMPCLREIAKRAGRDHALAERLWKTGLREARIVAAMVDDPRAVTGKQMERWVKDFDSWDVCDGACLHLLSRAGPAWEKASEWSGRTAEYQKRAGFVLMAQLAVHDKKAADERFLAFLPIIRRESGDARNFVKKAVNWALRQIGKRSLSLNRAAIRTAREIAQIDSQAARWVAADGIRELTGAEVQRRLRAKETKRTRR